MYSLIFFAPLFMFLALFFLGGRLGGYYTALAVAVSTFFSCVLCFDALATLVFHSFFFTYHLPLISLFQISWISVGWHFYLDQLVIFMFALITLVSFFIQLFSIENSGHLIARRLKFKVKGYSVFLQWEWCSAHKLLFLSPTYNHDIQLIFILAT